MPPVKRSKRKQPKAARRKPRPKPEEDKRREWDRGTEMLGLFVLTAHLVPVNDQISRPRPQSILLVGPPGSGKTELILRFRNIKGIVFRSDLTVRGLWRLLKGAEKHRIHQVILPEFNKVFQRKIATAVNCVGTLTEAMEEGVWESDVGPMQWSFNGARLGVLGGMTGRTLRKRRGLLYETGFLDRCAVLPWTLEDKEKKDILHRMTVGDRSDLSTIHIDLPEEPIPVDLPPKIGQHLEDFVWEHWPDESLRMLTRFRQLTMAAAMRDHRDVCKDDDIEAGVVQFSDYWGRLILTPGAEEDMIGGE